MRWAASTTASTASRSTREHGIYFPESDVNELAQAKGANMAGLQTVFSNYGLQFDDIDVFYLAGGFGRHVNVDAARRIGLIPDLADAKIVQGRQRRDRRRVHRLAFERQAAGTRTAGASASSIAGWKRIRTSSISSSRAASSSPSNRRSRWRDDRIRRHTAERRRRAGGVPAAAWDTRAIGCWKSGRANWRQRPARGTPSTVGRGSTPARPRASKSRTARFASTACRSSANDCSRCSTQADAESAILVAVSAGGELEREAQQLWLEEKPDEYFFLEVYGSAVVEHLITMKGAELCAWAESHRRGDPAPLQPGLSGVGHRPAARAA